MPFSVLCQYFRNSELHSFATNNSSCDRIQYDLKVTEIKLMKPIGILSFTMRLCSLVKQGTLAERKDWAHQILHDTQDHETRLQHRSERCSPHQHSYLFLAKVRQ